MYIINVSIVYKLLQKRPSKVCCIHVTVTPAEDSQSLELNSKITTFLTSNGKTSTKDKWLHFGMRGSDGELALVAFCRFERTSHPSSGRSTDFLPFI